MSALPNRGRVDLRGRYLRVALIAVVVFALVTVAVFVKRNPFATPYRLHAVFASANQLHKNSEVRVAGVRVGRVADIARGPNHTSIVTIEVSDDGLPIRRDATLKVKPRLLLEGNGYIDLIQGSRDVPALPSGATVPLAQTGVAVQLDQVLSVFDLATRGALHRSLGELQSGLGGRPTPGSAGLRDAVRQLDGALGSVTAVARAARGVRPGDLGRAISGSADVTTQLADDPRALADIVTSTNRVTRAMAAESDALAASISGFERVLESAPPTLKAIDRALPTVTSFAQRLTPTLRAAPRALVKTDRLLDQIAGIVSARELPRLLGGLTPVLRSLPSLEARVRTLFKQTTPVTNCIATHVIPTLNMKAPDGGNSTGDPVYLDLMHAFTGLTSLASAVDGNGGTVRLGVTSNETTLRVLQGIGKVAARLPHAAGVRPTWLGLGVNPPYRPEVPCAGQALPDLSKRSGPPPAWATRAPLKRVKR